MQPLNPLNRSAAATILAVFAIVIFFALGGLAYKALAEGPPAEVVANEPLIKEAKARLEKHRAAHEAFVADKALIEKTEKENNALGWRTDWATLKPVPIEPSFLQPL